MSHCHKKTIKVSSRKYESTMDQLGNLLRDLNIKKHKSKAKAISDMESETSMSTDNAPGPSSKDPGDFENYPEDFYWERHKGRYWSKGYYGKWWSIWWPKQASSSSSSENVSFKWFSNTDHY